MAAQQRLSELRAEISVAQQEVQAACSAGVAPTSLQAPAPPLEEAAAEGAGRMVRTVRTGGRAEGDTVAPRASEPRVRAAETS